MDCNRGLDVLRVSQVISNIATLQLRLQGGLFYVLWWWLQCFFYPLVGCEINFFVYLCNNNVLGIKHLWITQI